MPIYVGVQNGTWNHATHRFTIQRVEFVPGTTVVLMLTSQGAYANVDTGPTAGQFDETFQGIAYPTFERAATDTRVFCRPIDIERWPDPAVSGPYGAHWYSEEWDEFGHVTLIDEPISIVAVVPNEAYIDVVRGPDPHAKPRGSFIILDAPIVTTDLGNLPPMLYVPGAPDAAPARTAAWWAQVTASGTVDPSFALWQSTYWQGAPTPSLLVPTPKLWSTLSMVARRADGTETTSGLLTPVVDPETGFTRYDLIVEMQGAWPLDETFKHGMWLITMTPTTEILPLPDFLSDILVQPDPLPTVPPDPRYPPFAYTYPSSAWTRWISSLGMNNSDVFLAVLLSQAQFDTLHFPMPVIKGFHDATGVFIDPEHPELPYDNPVPLALEVGIPAAGFYSIATQIGVSTFNTTHDPNPIVDELTHIGDIPLARGGTWQYLGASRMPVVGQDPWWEIASMKPGEPQITDGTSAVVSPGDCRTGDVMLLVVQSNGVGAPTLSDPEGWIPIPALTGPNPNSGQPVIINTSLAVEAPAGSTTIQINTSNVLALPPPPLVVEIAENSYYDYELQTEVTLPAETVVAVNFYVEGYVVLQLGGATGGRHIGGTVTTIQAATPVLAMDQYVAAWWKIAEGEPPTEGVPKLSTETSVTVNFPDGDRCSGQMFAIVADNINPFSLEFGTSLDSMTRTDYPGAVQTLEVTDVNPEDAITCRGAIFLMMGYNKKLPGDINWPSSEGKQDIRQQSGRTGTIGPTDIGAIGHLPLMMWDVVGPDSIGCALYIAFRGYRDRDWWRTQIDGEPYEKVDGHYVPTLENRGVLPPCTGATAGVSDDYRSGNGIWFIPENAAGPEDPVTFIQREGQRGTTAYLRGWLVSTGDQIEATGYIYQRDPFSGVILDQQIWFTASATASDVYFDAPNPPGFYTDSAPYGLRVDVRIPRRVSADTYLGLNVWDEQFCQEPGVGVFGLGAGFRYKAEQLVTASSQQASIVG